MKRRTAATRDRQTKLLKVGATSTAFFSPIILAAAYLNLGQSSCGPPPPPPDFLVSKNLNGDPIPSAGGFVSADGSRIAYAPGAYPDPSLASQLFIFDPASGERRRVDPSYSGFVSAGVYDPVLSDDGRFIAFQHSADDPWFPDKIWWGDLIQDPLSSYTAIFAVQDPNRIVGRITMSGNGGHFAWVTDAALLPEDTDYQSDVYVLGFDLSLASGGPAGDGYSSVHHPKLSGDGEWIAFLAINLSGNRLIVVQRTDGTEVTQFAAGWNFHSISDDGSLVAYEKPDSPNSSDSISIFVFDRTAGTHQRVSLDNYGNPSTGRCEFPVIAGNGHRVAFHCDEPMTSHGVRDQLYVRDLESQITYLASMTENREPANATAVTWTFQADGNFAIVQTSADNFNFAPGDGYSHLYRVPIGYWEACDDQAYLPQNITCGAGACTATGTTSCVNGQIVRNCVPANAQTGIPENVCNGVDDDCDGQTDEDYQYQGQPAPCPVFVSPQPNGVVCTDRLWAQVAFHQPVDPANILFSAVLVEGLDTPSPIQTDVSQRFSVTSDAAHAIVDLTQLGRASLSVNGVSVTFERFGGGDPACPLCDDLGLTREELRPLVEDVADEVTNPWSNTLLVGESVALRLGCTLEPLPGAMAKAAASGGSDCDGDCKRTFCPGVSYCGIGNSQTSSLNITLPLDSCINEACFEHDKCYAANCLTDILCVFSEQGSVGSCDSNLLFACFDPTCVTIFAERVVCELATYVDALADFPHCGATPCGSDSICCQAFPNEAPSCTGGCWGDPANGCGTCFQGCAGSLACKIGGVCQTGTDVGSQEGNVYCDVDGNLCSD